MSKITKVWLRIHTVADIEATRFQWNDYRKHEFREARSKDLTVDEMLVNYNQYAHLNADYWIITWVSIAIDDNWIDCLTGDEINILKWLNEVLEMIQLSYADSQIVLCWFNLYNFDIPFLWKRMVINWIRPNKLLRIAQIKYQDINNYIWDVNKVWKQTGYWSELPLLIYNILWDKVDWDPYSASNNSWLLQKTREIWNRFENIFSSNNNN